MKKSWELWRWVLLCGDDASPWLNKHLRRIAGGKTAVGFGKEVGENKDSTGRPAKIQFFLVLVFAIYFYITAVAYCCLC